MAENLLDNARTQQAGLISFRDNIGKYLYIKKLIDWIREGIRSFSSSGDLFRDILSRDFNRVPWRRSERPAYFADMRKYEKKRDSRYEIANRMSAFRNDLEMLEKIGEDGEGLDLETITQLARAGYPEKPVITRPSERQLMEDFPKMNPYNYMGITNDENVDPKNIFPMNHWLFEPGKGSDHRSIMQVANDFNKIEALRKYINKQASTYRSNKGDSWADTRSKAAKNFADAQKMLSDTQMGLYVSYPELLDMIGKELVNGDYEPDIEKYIMYNPDKTNLGSYTGDFRWPTQY